MSLVEQTEDHRWYTFEGLLSICEDHTSGEFLLEINKIEVGMVRKSRVLTNEGPVEEMRDGCEACPDKDDLGLTHQPGSARVHNGIFAI
jgi:hypothetical protein